MVQRAAFVTVAKNIFDAFGDLITDVTYARPGAWNPVTETQTAASSETVRIARKEFDRRETDGVDVMVGDLEALIIQSELTATPGIDDTLTMGGVDYLVRAVGDMQGVVWRLHLRRV